MTVSELVAKGYSEVEACKIILQQAGLSVRKKAEVKRTISVNKNGGLYVKDPTFKAWSKTKNKEYTAGLNIDMNVARALFNNPELLEEIKTFINKSDDELEAIRSEKEAKKLVRQASGFEALMNM